MTAQAAEGIETRLVLEGIAKLRERALCVLSDGLVPGGFLCLGQSGLISAGRTGFREFERSAHIYRRGGA